MEMGWGGDPDLERWVSAKTGNTKFRIKTERNKENSKACETQRNKVQTLRAESRCTQTSKYAEKRTHSPTDSSRKTYEKGKKYERSKERHRHHGTETNTQEGRRQEQEEPGCPYLAGWLGPILQRY